MQQRHAAFLLAIIHFMAACRSYSSDGDQNTAGSEPPNVLLSEILAGVQGNNNLEFIELQNTGNRTVDLDGWSLWYQLPTDQNSSEVYRWETQAFIPARGHYLLVRTNQKVGASPDAYFEQSLNTSGGSLWLVDANDRRVDAISWGKASGNLGEGDPAVALVDGVSLERLPGGEAGNAQDQDDNRLDFSLRTDPRPQNVASPQTPGGKWPLKLKSSSPEVIKPGESFSLSLSLTNQSGIALQDLQVIVPLPDLLDVSPLQPGFHFQDGSAVWNVGNLDSGELAENELSLTAPWTYETLKFNNIHIDLAETGAFILAETSWSEIRGGRIPIAAARDLVGSEVIVEGVATMYTSGFFAGSGNVKFYIADESHGVQVWVPSGEGSLDVPIGARVRVRGHMELYRGARELVTATPEGVEILSIGVPPEPIPVSIQQIVHDEGSLPGRLVSVEGSATRIEEFNYSFEMDLVDESGNLQTLYIDKQTSMSPEVFELGRKYNAAGILEVQDGRALLFPRIPEDIYEVFPPVLRVEAEAPISVEMNEEFTIEFSVHNHTQDPQSGLELWVDIPPELRLISVEGDAEVLAESLRWILPEIPAAGGSAERSAVFLSKAVHDSILVDTFSVLTSTGLHISPEQPVQIFLGEIVPIWAIQWEGASSPFKLRELQTSGVVTGVFPELGGFWIQNTDPDKNSLTSEGLFITAQDLELQISEGDLVKVQGRVREISSQTQLQLNGIESLELISSNQDLPQALDLDPPRDTEAADTYFESIEGMLVQVMEPAVVVGPSSRYGEYVVVLSKHAKTRFYLGEETGWLIHVDDGSNIEHNDRSTLPYALSTHDEVEGLQGPLAYTHGNYKIEPLSKPTIKNLPTTLPDISTTDQRSFSVMTWNVENLFDILDPHPTSPPRPHLAEYEVMLTKVANTLLAAGAPSIVALQEVENIGILKDLAEHPLLVEHGYLAYLQEGTDSRGIDVGYLVKSSNADVIDVRQYPAPEGLTSRPPLMLHLKIRVKGVSTELYLLNNHFTSLAGGVAATGPRRTAQALWNIAILEQIRSKSPNAGIILLGDLNSFYESPPIDALRQAGLMHVYESQSEQLQYTYIFEGVSQTLDHILVNPSLFQILTDMSVLHVNADFALPPPDDTSPFRKSDHDPVIVQFTP